MLSFFSYAQTNREVASTYLHKSRQNYNKPKISKLQQAKSLEFIDTLTNAEVARSGSLMHLELENYEKAKKFADRYFLLEKNKSSRKYQDFLTTYSTIEDVLRLKNMLRKSREEKIALEKKRKDSLKSFWFKTYNKFKITADFIQNFDTNGFALYKENEKYGIINDKGFVIVKPNEYEKGTQFDGYFLLQNKAINPTKIFCFNSFKNKGFILSDLADVSPKSTHYRTIMLPRANARLVVYPNSLDKVLIFDMEKEKLVKQNISTTLKKLKEKKIITKYKSNNQIKVKGEWYSYGGSLGDTHILYLPKTNIIYGYLVERGGRILKKSEYPYMGFSYKDRSQVIKNKKTFWIDSFGDKVRRPINESGIYGGKTRVVRTNDGKFHFIQTINGERYLVNNNEKLEDLASFLKKHLKKD
ncbi:hypothetical protein WH52_14020 [Tenacibaculum holothuriorum]|uniref:Uncharacterized protein n=2 Tax=Tenacibaculum holothuriorum TaxID=1635173 RepID=A0A1Y2PAS0_9FLAO|nr:hypothetical protein WH52_14020 [Tenacibaculum holothuriorum]